MANITVSVPVDTFMSASTKAQMMTALSAGWTLDESTLTITWNGSTTGGLSVIGSTAGGGNAMVLKAGANTAFSAICFENFDDGIEHSAIGWGNSAVGGLLQNKSYWELSDLGTGSGAPLNGGVIVQTSATSHSPGAYTWVPRISIGADLGPIVLTGYDQSTHANSSLTISNLTAFFSTSDATQGTLGFDANACINFRNGNDSNACYSFGGTMADGKGWLFKTGGVAGSQVTRLQIANDGINFLAPIFNSGVAAFTLAKDTGWTANADGGDKTKVIPSNATLAAMATALNALVAGFGDAFVASTEKMKALEAALVALVLPNA